MWPPRWSPDGRTLLFDARAERYTEVYAAPAQGASGPVKPNRVVLGSGASWSRDGKSILFQARGQIWRANPDGGSPRPIVKDPGANWPVESFDGKYIFYRNRRTIWRVPAEGGMPEQVFAPMRGILWPFIQPVKSGMYYTVLRRPRAGWPSRSSISRPGKAHELPDADPRTCGSARSFSVSPDGRYIVYPQMGPERHQADGGAELQVAYFSPGSRNSRVVSLWQQAHGPGM